MPRGASSNSIPPKMADHFGENEPASLSINLHMCHSQMSLTCSSVRFVDGLFLKAGPRGIHEAVQGVPVNLSGVHVEILSLYHAKPVKRFYFVIGASISSRGSDVRSVACNNHLS